MVGLLIGLKNCLFAGFVVNKLVKVGAIHQGYDLFQLPNGAFESCQIAGFDLDSGMGAPWNIVDGSVEALRGEDTVIVDDLYKGKLGVTKIGDVTATDYSNPNRVHELPDHG